jgi:hypothetical protein
MTSSASFANSVSGTWPTTRLTGPRRKGVPSPVPPTTLSEDRRSERHGGASDDHHHDQQNDGPAAFPFADIILGQMWPSGESSGGSAGSRRIRSVALQISSWRRGTAPAVTSSHGWAPVAVALPLHRARSCFCQGDCD